LKADSRDPPIYPTKGEGNGNIQKRQCRGQKLKRNEMISQINNYSAIKEQQ